MPDPTMLILARVAEWVTACACISWATGSMMPKVRVRSVRDTVNEISVTFWWLTFWTMTSTLIAAASIGAKMPWAIPGRSGTLTIVILATSVSWAIARTRSRPSSGMASPVTMVVPGASWKLDRTTMGIP